MRRAITAVVAILALLGSIGLAGPLTARADAPPSSPTPQASSGGNGLPGDGQSHPGQLPYYYYAPSGPVGDMGDLLAGLGGFFTNLGSPLQKAGECFSDLAQCFVDTLVGVIKFLFAPLLALAEFTFSDLLGNTGKEITVEARPVLELMHISRAIALALLAVVLMWGGMAIMVNRHLASPYHELAELLPRVAAAVALIAAFPWLATFLIDVNNALVRVVIHPQELRSTWMEVVDALGAPPLIIFWLVLVVLGAFLAGQLLMRFVILDLLLVTGPIAFMLWVLPQTRKWNELWSTLFPATLFQQAVQAWTLVLGFRLVNLVWREAGGTASVERGLLLPGTPLYAGVGLSAAIVTGLAAIAVMLAALKVPDILGRAVGYWQPGWSPILATFNLARSYGLFGRGGGNASAATGARGG